MKKILPWLIYVVVAAQIIWLAWNYHTRSVELATAPRILIATQTYDPRDLTRGYYQRLDASVSLNLSRVSSLCGASVDQSKLKEKLLKNIGYDPEEYTLELTESLSPAVPPSATAKELPTMRYEDFPLSTFWKKQASGLWEICRIEQPDSPEAAAADGELHVPMIALWRINYSTIEETGKTKVNPTLLLSFPGLRNLRYYYPEEKGDFFSLLRQKEHPSPIDITVELLIRPSASIMPTQLYLNGIPYNEATELLKQDKFPFREHPQP